MRMRARWLFYLLLGFFSASLVAGAALVVWVDYQRTITAIENQAREAASAYAGHARRNIHELTLGIEWLGRHIDPRAPDYGLTAETTATASLLPTYLPGLSGLVFVDASGRVRFSTATDRSLGADVSGRDYFIAARDRKVPIFIGPTVRAIGTQQLVYTVTKRIEVDGRFAGVALAGAVAARWEGITAGFFQAPGTRVRLLRSDGAVIVDKIRRAREGGFVAFEIERRPEPPLAADTITVRLPVSDYPLTVESSVPRKAALKDWRVRTELTVTGAGLGLAALAVFGILGQRTLRREAAAVATVARRTQELEAGTAELDRAVATQRLLIDELNHRVKNTLATVQSIAAQSFRAEGTGRESLAAFEARLIALAKAHSLLTRENWKGAELRDVAEQALAPFGQRTTERFSIHGDNVQLRPKVALALAMAFHELATNAAKFGALSTHTGQVAIEWGTEPSRAGDRLHLMWREFGGPPVSPPHRRGFGSRLIERGLALELGGTVKLEYLSTGVVCTINVPLLASR